MVSATEKTARMVPYERQYDTGKDDFATYHVGKLGELRELGLTLLDCGFLDEEGEEDGEDEDAEDDGEGDESGDMPVEELATDHLHSDEGEQHTEAVMQHPETIGYIAQEEEERAQSHDSKDVGSIDDDRILGHGEDCRNGVDSEDDVAELNHQED